MCLYPKLAKNKKYTETAKNGGNVPIPTDLRVLRIPIACQNCIECRKAKAREWQVRLMEDIKTNNKGVFVTLTFSNEWIKKIVEGFHNKNGEWIPGIDKKIKGYDVDDAIATKATRWFMERWRKKTRKSLRHWLVTEIGGQNTENIHLHGIIWTNQATNTIRDIWQYGYIYPSNDEERKYNYVNEKTINYVTKYIYKRDEKHTQYKGKILASDGIGKEYTTGYDSKRNIYKNGPNEKTNETYRTRTGHKISLPIYWRNKIYTEEQREKLWIEKLDKEQRWIRGEKISIKNGNEEYFKLLKWHQELNKELGYGDDKKNWKIKQYENELRNIKKQERIKNASPAGSNQRETD